MSSQWDNPDHCPSGHDHGPHAWSNPMRAGIMCPGHRNENPNLGRQFVDLYHGTDAESARSIKRTGLHPAEGRPDVMTVAHDPKTAEDYAHDAADYRGGRPALVHLRVPEKEWHEKYQGEGEDWGYSYGSGLRETIPPEHVHKVTPLKKRPGSYYH